MHNLSLTDLKAYAYDLISRLEAIQGELQAVNAAIAKKLNEQQEQTTKNIEKTAV